MLTYCLKCKKHTYNIKIKIISKCATFLANKTFFDKIKDKDELEVTVSPFLID